MRDRPGATRFGGVLLIFTALLLFQVSGSMMVALLLPGKYCLVNALA